MRFLTVPFLVPFVLMMVVNLATFSLDTGYFGMGLTLHVGLIPISGLLFGPFGALGLVIANIICDVLRGYDPMFFIFGEIFTFIVSCMAYKLWYHKFVWRKQITKPLLNNTNNIIVFLFIILLCSIIFSLGTVKTDYFAYSDEIGMYFTIMFQYFLNFVNASFIFGILGMWLSKKISFNYLPSPPQKSELQNDKLEKAILYLLIIVAVIVALGDFVLAPNVNLS